MNKDILIFAEQRDGKIQNISLELLHGGKKLASTLNGRLLSVLPGYQTTETARQLLAAGADLVITIDHPALAEYHPSYYTKAAASAIQKWKPSLVLFGSTTIGIELAARTAGRLGAGLITDCTGIFIKPNTKECVLTRPDMDGISINTFTYVLPKETYCPKMATIRQGVLAAQMTEPAAEYNSAHTKGTISNFYIDFSDETDARILSTSYSKEKHTDISNARILVAGGRGIGGPDGFQILRRIADLLDGEIACSRACVEAGWIDAAPQVGQTGKTVRPELYLACGISGAFQHVTGMEDSHLIIAINKSPSAPIFDISDLGIVGSLEVILPALIEALEAYTGRVSVS